MWTIAAVHGVPTLPAMVRARAAGFEAWTPKLVERRRRPKGRGMMTVETPAYVGYLLLPDSVDLDALRLRFRSWRIRGLQGRGSVLSDARVEDLRELEAAWRAAAYAPKPRRVPFVAGAPVLINVGLFEGRRGQVHADNGGGHVVLHLPGSPSAAAADACGLRT